MRLGASSDLVVHEFVSRIARLRIAPGILVATVVGLFGCPQLLDDGFSTAKVCLDESCTTPYSKGGSSGNDAGSAGAGSSPSAGAAGTSAGSGNSGASGSAGSGSSGASGSAGRSGNAGASGSNAGVAGASGAAGAGGTGGTGETADAGGSAGQPGGAGTAGSSSGGSCTTLDITGPSQSESSNCVGIYGWNGIQIDTTTNTNVALTFNNGAPCFTGTIASSGWGATYEMTFANAQHPDSPQLPGEVWNATNHGVTGFEFAYSGANQPASLHIIYKDPSGTDFCKIIGPGAITVPFSAGHPSCSSSGGTVDITQLSYLILAFPVNNQAYNVDFCVQISAIQ